ncbi:hypothetical protein Leryth_000116 [Lithospermum erythrorhizon]|nr:hypothetical protein Leryth_000116 [Lithospermum erythrorhizon]
MSVVEQPLPENSMAFDEVSMERSKSFINALQNSKSKEPQLYSAAEYCEKSYLHSEEKQMVLDNLKDYTVRALVNAIDHLGTVAFKLTDLLEQQSTDISNMDLKVTCLNQQLLTCQIFTDEEGLRQQQLSSVVPRHHKHYILPNSVNKKVHFSPHIRTDPSQQVQAKPLILPSGTPAPNALSWHLASETKSTLKGSARALLRPGDQNVPERTMSKTNAPMTSLDPEDNTRSKHPTTHPKVSRVGPASSAAIQTLGVLKEGNHQAGELTTFRSFDNPSRQQIIRPPARSKSMFSAFFVKYKTMKVRSTPVS